VGLRLVDRDADLIHAIARRDPAGFEGIPHLNQMRSEPSELLIGAERLVVGVADDDAEDQDERPDPQEDEPAAAPASRAGGRAACPLQTRRLSVATPSWPDGVPVTCRFESPVAGLASARRP